MEEKILYSEGSSSKRTGIYMMLAAVPLFLLMAVFGGKTGGILMVAGAILLFVGFLLFNMGMYNKVILTTKKLVTGRATTPLSDIDLSFGIKRDKEVPELPKVHSGTYLLLFSFGRFNKLMDGSYGQTSGSTILVIKKSTGQYGAFNCRHPEKLVAAFSSLRRSTG